MPLRGRQKFSEKLLSRLPCFEEIGRLIEALGPTVLEAKRVFPGATVTGIRKPEIDWEKLPF